MHGIPNLNYLDDYQGKVITTRKPHSCRVCSCIIPKGARAFRETAAGGFEDGQVTVYTCLTCNKKYDVKK